MPSRAGRAKKGRGTREVPVPETTTPPCDRPCVGNVIFDGHNSPMQCISLSQQLPEMRKQGLREGERSGEGHKPGKWLSWNSKPDALVLKFSQVPFMSRGASAVHIRVEGSQGRRTPCCRPQWISPTPGHCCSKFYLILGSGTCLTASREE